MRQRVKDPALSLRQLGLLLWHGFDPWLRNLYMPGERTKKKKKKHKLSLPNLRHVLLGPGWCPWPEVGGTRHPHFKSGPSEGHQLPLGYSR